MRTRALAAFLLVTGAATGAAAQSAQLTPPTQDNGIFDGLFTVAFAPAEPTAEADPIGGLLERDALAPDGSLVRWRTTQVQISDDGSAVNSLRINLGDILSSPGGLPVNLEDAQVRARAFEVALTRDWPAVLTYEGETYNVDVSPHAGVGLSSAGGSAEAGAVARLGKSVSDGKKFGNRGRWYLYAAASGKAVGLNVLKDDTGWNRAGWTMDASSALISDAQLGVGWRRGAVQTSFGYVHREVKGRYMLMGQEAKDDSLVAFSLSIKPKK
jgi:hypothetical protein